METRLAKHRLLNWLQSFLLLGGISAVLALVGWMLAGKAGLIWIGFLALVSGLMVPRVSPFFLVRLYGGIPLHPQAYPELYELLATLCRRAGIPVPTLFYIPSTTPNAFAVGNTDNAAIGLTDGLLQSMSLRELAAVLAHEISHIRHHDLGVMNLADWMSRLTNAMAMAGQIALFFTFPFWLIAGNLPILPWLILMAAPWISALLQLALSRTREFDADLGAVELTGDPEGLVSALYKLERSRFDWRSIFLPGWRQREPSWLRTHPPTEERIQRLLALRREERRLPRIHLEFIPPNGIRPKHPRWYWPGLWY